MNRYKNDLILIGAVLLVALVGFFALKAAAQKGSAVRILSDGQQIGSYPLSENTEVSIKNGKNILVIEDGFAFMEAADCPDKICVSHKKISNKGETIVCLPNKVVVEIE